MTSRIILTPVGHVPAPLVHSSDGWSVFIDHVDVKPCPKGWPLSDIIIFRADKCPAEMLMIPEAHFYGRTAYGMLLHHDWLRDTIDYQTVRYGSHDAANRRKMTLVLCRADGGELPEVSPELYPSSSVGSCPVSLKTFLDINVDDDVCLVPDPCSVDPAVTPRAEWVYAVADRFTKDDPHAVHMHVHHKIRNHVFPSGKVVKYSLRGPVLRHKIVQTPLSRDAGYHTAPGPISRERATRNTQKRRLQVTTKKYVLALHDFKIGGVEVRVDSINKTGFTAHRLLT